MTKKLTRSLNIKSLLVPSHYVYESHTRGSEYRHAFEISNAIASKWPDSVVITGKITEESTYPYRIIEVQPNEAVYKMTASKAILFAYRYTVAAIKLLRRERFDVLHHVRPFQIGYTFNLIQILGFNKGKKFILGSFSSPYQHEVKGSLLSLPFRFVLKQLSIKTIKSADAVVVYDEETKKMINKYTSNDKIMIIAPGVDGALYKPLAKSFDSHIKFISVGYLIPRKRFDYLIEVFREINILNPNTSLDIYGDGEQKEYLNALINKYELSDVIKLKGFINNSKLSEKYSDAHIFISLQEEESFGQVYIEALASGLPIITTVNKGSNLIIDETVGLKFDLNDKQVLVEQVDNLLSKPHELNNMSKAARKKFLKYYDSKVIAKKWIKLYENLLTNDQSN